MLRRIAEFIAAAAAVSAVAAMPTDLTARSDAASKVGFVSVNVATVWTDQSKPRPVDAPALTNPADIQGWLSTMTLKQYLDLTDSSRTQTQATYGARVAILNETDKWYEVAVAGQPTPKETLGYPGWVPKVQISLDEAFGQLQTSKPFAQVKDATTMLYRDAKMTDKIMELSFDTRLPVLEETKDAFKVAVPGGGCAYLSKKWATCYRDVASIPYPTGGDLVKTAKLFIGRPYLWGGTSGFAYDCSGFTHTIYDAHGITIPRDADAQADFTGHGTNVTKDNLRPGDLLYYAKKLDDPSTIHHVAMYVGDNKMAEAYGAGIPVRITDARFDSEFWGGQRFLKK